MRMSSKVDELCHSRLICFAAAVQLGVVRAAERRGHLRDTGEAWQA